MTGAGAPRASPNSSGSRAVRIQRFPSGRRWLAMRDRQRPVLCVLSLKAMEQSAYEQLLAESIRDTFDHPDGQTHGRRGRRCVLEDGERRLGCCIRARPSDLYPRLLLAKNLMRQGRGREADILPMVMAALWDADFEDESPEALALIKVQQPPTHLCTLIFQQDHLALC